MKTKTLLESAKEVIDGFAQGGVIPSNVRLQIQEFPKFKVYLNTEEIEISSVVTMEALFLEMCNRLGVKTNYTP